MAPKLDYVCKIVKVIVELAKQTMNYSELVRKMNIISVIKVTRVVIVSMYVRLAEIFKNCYNLHNTLTALKEKNKEAMATKKSQVQLKHIKLASVISRN